MAATISSICLLLRVTCSLVSFALRWALAAASTLRPALLDRSSTVAYSSCTALACSVAPWARAWAPLDSCSAWLDTRCSAWMMLLMASEMDTVKRPRASSMGWKSPMYRAEVDTSKFPWASSAITRSMSATYSCTRPMELSRVWASWPSSFLER